MLIIRYLNLISVQSWTYLQCPCNVLATARTQTTQSRVMPTTCNLEPTAPLTPVPREGLGIVFVTTEVQIYKPNLITMNLTKSSPYQGFLEELSPRIELC